VRLQRCVGAVCQPRRRRALQPRLFWPHHEQFWLVDAQLLPLPLAASYVKFKLLSALLSYFSEVAAHQLLTV